MDLKLTGKFEVIEILKPTKRKLICDLVVGDVFEIESIIKRQYQYSGRKGAVWLELKFKDKTYSYSYTELDTILQIIKLKQIN